MATTDKRLTITDLDFDDIKANLKTFMRNQSEFTDYDFEGSGINAVLDVLAYNTHYLAMNVNMAANEMFLDTSSIRSSAVSHAKTLGYIPNSVRAPVAYIDVTLNNFGTTTIATLPRGTKFNASVDDVNYDFVTVSDFTALASNSVLSFSNIPIYEGTYTTNRYTVNTQNVDQRFVLTNNRADTTTMKVQVFQSSDSTQSITYTQATDITQAGSTANVYFLQEVEDGKFEIYFGDGIVGRALSNGNVVVITYVVTNKTAANTATGFNTSASISGISDITVATSEAASGGAEAESIKSIKLNAPLDYASQGRAVTPDDYKVIIPKIYANTKSVQVWGGEDNATSVYGRVYISIVPTTGAVTTAAKADIVRELKSLYTIASVTPVIVDPVTTFIRFQTNFKYNEKDTTQTKESLISKVTTALTNYDSNELQSFEGIFRHSYVTGLIDDTDDAILSNVTTVKLAQRITPTLNTETKYTLNFNNALYYPHSGHDATGGGILSSTGFKISGNTNEMFLNDDGMGNIRMYYITGGSTKTYVNNTAGTIDYATGTIVLTSLNITSISNVDLSTSNTIRVVVIPSSYDIAAVRNQILKIDFTNSLVAADVDTIASGGSAAGTSYTTSTVYSSSSTASTSTGY